ncbi:MAG: excisionase family DNA-binding protein [Bdellovibrionales bacterium]|nr:excisionase family DNA-binding protein [Bdellovibrionales bacterium]
MDLSAKLLSIQEYPFIIKRQVDKLVIYSPDLNLSYSELPIIQKLSPSQKPHYFQMLGIAVLKAWQKGELKKEEMIKKHLSVPLPSEDLVPSRPLNEPLLSPIQIAKKMGCHKDTIRRAIDRGELKCTMTPGGHRKVLQSVAEEWVRSSQVRPKGRPLSSLGKELCALN